MNRYHIVPFAKLDEAIRFRDALIRFLLQFPEQKAVIKSIVEPQEEEFREFQAVFFLNDVSFEMLTGAGIKVRVLKTLPEDEVRSSATVDFGVDETS